MTKPETEKDGKTPAPPAPQQSAAARYLDLWEQNLVRQATDGKLAPGQK